MSIARRPRPLPSRHDPEARRRPPRHRLTSRRAELATRWRRWLARAPVGTVLLATAAALVVVSLRLAPSDAALDPALAVPVVVATVDLASGTVVAADDVEVRPVATVALPRSSVAAPDEVVGRQVTATILAGEPIVTVRLAPDGLVGVAAATPPSWSAFALPSEAERPDAAVGQTVDLYALDTDTDTDLAAGTGTGDALLVAGDAVVVAVDDGRLTVAVRARDAPAVAAALLGSTVVVAVTAPGDGDDTGSGGAPATDGPEGP